MKLEVFFSFDIYVLIVFKRILKLLGTSPHLHVKIFHSKDRLKQARKPRRYTISITVTHRVSRVVYLKKKGISCFVTASFLSILVVSHIFSFYCQSGPAISKLAPIHQRFMSVCIFMSSLLSEISHNHNQSHKGLSKQPPAVLVQFVQGAEPTRALFVHQETKKKNGHLLKNKQKRRRKETGPSLRHLLWCNIGQYPICSFHPVTGIREACLYENG